MINKSKKAGALSRLKSRLEHNRLGDLLVSNGLISQQQLSEALASQKDTGLALGAILKAQGLITTGTLRLTLTQQLAWRSMAACLAFVIGFSVMGIQTTRATAATFNDDMTTSRSYPDDAKLQEAAIDTRVKIKPAPAYPSLFGTDEVRSADISPFTKWTGIMARLNSKNSALPDELADLHDEDDDTKLEAVNKFFNKIRYIEDKNNWGTSDYWETPSEFLSRGGDCEDFAIAKYAALKNLGFPEKSLRLAIVQDTWKGIPHAVLVVYTDDGAKFLDNQYKTVKSADGFDRYKPVYSINRTGWWRHL